MAFSKTLLFALSALLAVSPISALPISSELKRTPYDASNLESYDTYHSYYVAAGCTGKQGTQFFEDCCHPRLKGSMTDRPAQCSTQAASATVAPASVSASDAAAATQSDVAEDDEVCTDDGTEAEETDCADDETASETSTPAPTPTPSTVADNAVVDTTPTVTPVTPTSTPPAATPTAPSTSYDHSGSATFYYQNGVAGSCGVVHSDNDFIAAMTPGYKMQPGSGSGCDRQVEIRNPDNGKVITVAAVDTCPTCVSDDSIDLSKAAFLALASGGEGEGLFNMEWKFV